MDVPEAVLRSLRAAAGGAKAWPLRVKRALVATTTVSEGSPTQTVHSEIWLTPLEQGLIRARTKDAAEGSSSEHTSVYGFYEASSLVSYGRHSSRRRVVEFSADAPLLGLADHTVFAFTQRVHMLVDGTESTTLYRTKCSVGARRFASTVHPALTGTALPIDCSSTVDSRPANTTKGFLLPESGWYFQESMETSFYKGTSRLMEVEPW